MKKFIEWTRKNVRVLNIKIWQFRELIKINSKLCNDVKMTLINLARDKSRLFINWSRVCLNDFVDFQKIFKIFIRFFFRVEKSNKLFIDVYKKKFKRECRLRINNRRVTRWRYSIILFVISNILLSKYVFVWNNKHVFVL